jgi:hypothetical protein
MLFALLAGALLFGVVAPAGATTVGAAAGAAAAGSLLFLPPLVPACSAVPRFVRRIRGSLTRTATRKQLIR